MMSGRCSRSLITICAVFAVMAMLVSAASAGPKPGAKAMKVAPASTTSVVFSFNGGSEGGYPDTELVMDGGGNIYGTAVEGGEFGGGTVFQLTPSGDTWTETVLYSFSGGKDGGEPYKGVTLDSQGNLYGTAVTGGTGGACEGGCGVAYKLTKAGGSWSQSVIHNFTGGNDGYGPGAGVTFDAAGNLYGMTPTGGAYGLGVIYQLRPQPDGRWRLRVIHAFTGGTDGGTGSAGRLVLEGGNLYGVATVGGAHGAGTVFELRPNLAGGRSFRTLYAFKGDPDAGFPYGAVTFDAAGNLYGTTYYEGANDLGAVYELMPTPVGPWKERVLHSFQGGTDGASSISGLVFDAAGNLYGTTSEGGSVGGGSGTIFILTPGDHGTWTESVAHAFTGPPDGAFPYDGLVADGAGNFYGATVHGGTDDEGSIYEFTPSP